jgi:hypothetical protein
LQPMKSTPNRIAAPRSEEDDSDGEEDILIDPHGSFLASGQPPIPVLQRFAA